METDKGREDREKWKQRIYQEYLGNECKELRRMAMAQYGKFIQNGNINEHDFMSVANETFWRAVENYDANKNDNFQAFLSMCLHNRILNEFNRIQSIANVTVSNKTVPIESSTQDEIGLDEMLDDRHLTDDCINPHGLSDRAFNYVSSFYGIYSEILDMIMDGYTEDEIISNLNLTRRQYSDCMNKLRSHKHTVLMNQ